MHRGAVSLFRNQKHFRNSAVASLRRDLPVLFFLERWLTVWLVPHRYATKVP